MGIREKLNDKPAVAAGIGVGAVVWRPSSSSRSSRTAAGRPTARISRPTTGRPGSPTTASNIPPFAKDGKEAVRAYVFECGGKQFVNHLERFTPEAKEADD
jgi:hypothetical protein